MVTGLTTPVNVAPSLVINDNLAREILVDDNKTALLVTEKIDVFWKGKLISWQQLDSCQFVIDDLEHMGSSSYRLFS